MSPQGFADVSAIAQAGCIRAYVSQLRQEYDLPSLADILEQPQHPLRNAWWQAFLDSQPVPIDPPTPPALPGYICEVCFDAPAVALVSTPQGGTLGCCATCRTKEGTSP